MPEPVPFSSADEAYIWAYVVSALRARGTEPVHVIPRPCDAQDVIRLVKTLREAARLEVIHVRCIELWAAQGKSPPTGTEPREVWDEAMTALEWPLTNRGWVKRLTPRPSSTLFRNR